MSPGRTPPIAKRGAWRRGWPSKAGAARHTGRYACLLRELPSPDGVGVEPVSEDPARICG